MGEEMDDYGEDMADHLEEMEQLQRRRLNHSKFDLP